MVTHSAHQCGIEQQLGLDMPRLPPGFGNTHGPLISYSSSLGLVSYPSLLYCGTQHGIEAFTTAYAYTILMSFDRQRGCEHRVLCGIPRPTVDLLLFEDAQNLVVIFVRFMTVIILDSAEKCTNSPGSMPCIAHLVCFISDKHH